MRAPIFAVLAAMFIASAPPRLSANEGFHTTGDLYQKCNLLVRVLDDDASLTNKQQIDAGYCLGFIQADGVDQSFREPDAAYCTPYGIKMGQRARIFVTWGKNHPERFHLPDLAGLRLSLAEAFPCG